MFSRSKVFTLLLLLPLAFGATGDAFARAGGGGSFGSRGGRTFSAPSSTSVAPSAAPITRSMQPGPGSSFAQPARTGGFFSGGGFGRGLLGGLVGAGLFGLLFGHGMFGGLGGGESFLGLLLQVGLLLLGAKLLLNFFRRRQQPALGGAAFSPLSGGAMPFGASGGGSGPVRSTPLSVAAADFDTFERRLGEVQAAYSSGDTASLRRVATAEMAGNLGEELADHERRGHVNRLSDVKLEAGDLSEAWSEGSVDFATVAMRYSLVDQTFERTSGKLMSGSASPQTVTEVWTFTRPAGAGSQSWILSAIQQA